VEEAARCPAARVDPLRRRHGSANDLVGVGHGTYSAFPPLRATEFVTEVDEIAGPMDGSSSWEDEGIDERLTRLIRISNELRSEGE
jgi:hypothetical protein